MMREVPTVAQLYAQGRHLAYPVAFRKADKKSDPPVPTKWAITPEGHKLLGDIMRENAEEALARGDGDWQQPPSRTDLGGAHAS
jgi:hypothetical protein